MSNILPFDPVKAVAERNADIPRRLAKDDGGGNDGGMEARVAKLEAVAEHLRRDVDDLRADVKELRRDVHGIRTTDFRLIFGAIIAVSLGLAGIMAKGFGWL